MQGGKYEILNLREKFEVKYQLVGEKFLEEGFIPKN